MSPLARIMWGIIGFILTLLGLAMLFLPGPGLLVLFFGILVLIAAEVPVISGQIVRLIDWLEEKTGWEIHEKMHRLGSGFKRMGLKIKRIKKSRRK